MQEKQVALFLFLLNLCFPLVHDHEPLSLKLDLSFVNFLNFFPSSSEGAISWKMIRRIGILGRYSTLKLPGGSCLDLSCLRVGNAVRSVPSLSSISTSALRIHCITCAPTSYVFPCRCAHTGDCDDNAQQPSLGPSTGNKPDFKTYLLRLFALWQQGLVASIGAVMGIGLIIYCFSAPMKEDTVHHTAAMASEALQDPNLRLRAVELSKQVVREVLNDPNSLNLTVHLVVQLLSREEVKVAISSLLQNLFEDRYCQEMTKKFILVLLRDPWVGDQLDEITKKQIHRLLEDREVKMAFADYIAHAASETLQKPQIHDKSASAIRLTLIQLMNPVKFFSKD